MTDSNEPTAWQEINPPIAQQRGQLPHGFADRLTPVDRETFAVEMAACLALTAPVGMNEAARTEWIGVAWETLKHLPADLLSIGCAKARETCDHPSKIVPTIIAETKDSLRFRHDMAKAARIDRPALPKPDYVTPAEASAILEEFGLKSSFQSQGG